MNFLYNKYIKLMDIFSLLIKISAMIFLILLFANVLLQILARNVLSGAYTFTAEIARFSFIWISFLGAALAVREEGHFTVNIISNKLKKKNKKKYLKILSLVITFIISYLLFYHGINFFIVGFGRTSESAGITLGYVYLALPTSGLFMILFTIEKFIALFIKKK